MREPPEPLPVKELVEADLWDQLPSDLPALLALLPQADLSLQDEIQFAFHPTRQPGLVPQRVSWATVDRGSWGQQVSVYGFGLVDWRDGWEGGRIAPGRTADVFCEQVRAAAARAARRGRAASDS